MTRRMRLEAPAKVNLWLRVFGRDTKGYHALETLFQLVGVADTLAAETTAGGITLSGAPPELGDTAANLIVRAAEAYVRDGDRDAGARSARTAYELVTAIGWTCLRDVIASFARRARLDVGVPDDAPPSPADRFGLTARELDVLALVAEGCTNRQIADALFISAKTASVHVSNILGKLGVASRTEAAAVAHRLGLLEGAAMPATTRGGGI